MSAPDFGYFKNMPDGNSADEKRQKPDDTDAERKAALEDLVDLIMSGETYPKHGRTRIDLDTILREADAATISDVIRGVLFAPSKGTYDLFYGVEEIVKWYLEDSQWHEQRIVEMREEES